ncbi:MAG TPA: T9SS type A sorting domain-containing protein [candidate division WOR-3 bacterium]|uniref:T9SS type A sorting domain-containing protein n=1 Tax=candidate division WOR-3 bacterium TaxID=2052148 RepID=A0A9C9ENN0_UNCW3|nr:T9SS type A sorting domain-containing protein [candidate division WOR-3 bacterium]
MKVIILISIFSLICGLSAERIEKRDFLINDDKNLASGCSQEWPSVAMSSAGDFVVVWEDARNGDDDIYCQRYNYLGIPQGPSVRVNDDAGSTDQKEASVAIDSAGNSVIVWVDYRNGPANIYAQRYDPSGTPQGPNFQVSTGESHPSVGMDDMGNFVIVWVENQDIYAQRFDSSGNPQGTSFKVNDDAGSNYQGCPRIAMDGEGNFVVTWSDHRSGDLDIYAQRYDAAGNPQGPNFKVNDDVGSFAQDYSAVAIASTKDFVIVWGDRRNGNFDIYAQRYDSSGNPQGPNFKVNDAGPRNEWYCSVAMDSMGNFFIVWQDERDVPNLPNIYGQYYDAAGNPLGPNFLVNDELDLYVQFVPSVAMDEGGNSVVVWQDGRGYDIYGQRYNPLGTPIGSNFRVNYDDVGSYYQKEPAIAMNSQGNFVAVWTDSRSGEDIYGQLFDATGEPIGSNFRVNNDITESHWYPSVAMDDAGNFLVAWTYGPSEILGQRYDAAGNPQGPNFLVNDVTTSFQAAPSVAMNGTGNSVIVWVDNRNGPANIYAQRYDPSGTPQGPNFQVSTGGSWPSVAIDSAGNFVVAWATDDIYARRYDAAGNPQGASFKVNDDVGTNEQGCPAIAIDNAGNFVITWHDKRNGNWDIYGQRYDAAGNPLGSNFKVNDDAGTTDQLMPSIAIDPISSHDRFVIVWPDNRNLDGDPEILAQKYEGGNPVLGNLQINQPDLFPYNHQSLWRFSVTCNDTTVGFVWMDNRRHKAWDIYGKLTYWNLTVDIAEKNGIGNQSPRISVYPNPFTKSTVIRYSSLAFNDPRCPTLRIYDATGRLVKSFILSTSIVWDGKDMHGKEVQSGVYFLRIEKYTPAKVVKLR